MNAQSETYDEEEYEEFDEFDEDDGERGLSGLVVLLMGVVMLGAFASIVWIAYQQGVKSRDGAREVPVVAADPEPLKIENETVAAADGNERTVYDRFDGAESEPVEILTEGPEEPLARTTDDPIAAIARDNADPLNVVDDAVADRIASLAAADAALESEAETQSAPAAQETPPPQTAPAPKPAAAETSQPASSTTAQVVAAGTALGGSHVVQVGAFRSENEADGFWSRMDGKLGDYLAGKAKDIERADLGDKGIYYRLRIGPFASSADAKTYCEGLKTRGQDCLVKAK